MTYGAVTPIRGERWRFYVRSFTDPDRLGPYLVDLEEYGWNGECGCQDFIKKKTQLEAGAVRSRWLQCKHIQETKRVVFEWLMDGVKWWEL